MLADTGRCVLRVALCPPKDMNSEHPASVKAALPGSLPKIKLRRVTGHVGHQTGNKNPINQVAYKERASISLCWEYNCAPTRQRGEGVPGGFYERTDPVHESPTLTT